MPRDTSHRSSRSYARLARAMLALGLLTMAAVALSGWAGHGRAGFGVSLLCLVATRLLMRPWLVTRASSTALLAEVLGQAVVAALLHGLGVGLATLTGWQPPVPSWLPGALILGAGILGRALWTPIPPDLEQALGEMTAQLEALADDLGGAGQEQHERDASIPPSPEALRACLDALDALPVTGAPHAALVDAVVLPTAEVPLDVLIPALRARALATGTDRDQRALIVLVTDPWVAGQPEGAAALEPALQLASETGCQQALRCWATQVEALVDLRPDVLPALPEAALLHRIATGLDGTAPDAGLIQLLREVGDRIAALRADGT